MLSVLIPTYNYSIFSLVSMLFEQLEKEKIDFEIICLDDASSKFHTENQQINALKNCSYTILEKNIGRSCIRNLLAKKANFENLLFLDADVIPLCENFIATYLLHVNSEEKVVYGGVRYQTKKPEKSKILRWVYGKSRESLPVQERNKNEYLSFLTMHFLAKKKLFEKVSFNESMTKWGHEDTLFSSDLKKNSIKILHIENPIIHLGLENSIAYLEKSEQALKSLKFLIDNQLIDPEYVRLSKKEKMLQNFGLKPFFLIFYHLTKRIFLRNLRGKKPSILFFDLYRLGYFCNLNSK